MYVCNRGSRSSRPTLCSSLPIKTCGRAAGSILEKATVSRYHGSTRSFTCTETYWSPCVDVESFGETEPAAIVAGSARRCRRRSAVFATVLADEARFRSTGGGYSIHCVECRPRCGPAPRGVPFLAIARWTRLPVSAPLARVWGVSRDRLRWIVITAVEFRVTERTVASMQAPIHRLWPVPVRTVEAAASTSRRLPGGRSSTAAAHPARRELAGSVVTVFLSLRCAVCFFRSAGVVREHHLVRSSSPNVLAWCM